MQETIQIKIGKLIFDCRTDGDKENELVIFLHGFPETSYMWGKLMAHFSKNGFYCVAPNLRGYSKGACPKGKKHYSLDKLAKDVLGIAKFLNKSKFHLVGHDWGSVIGWKVVHGHENLILSWTGISVPHFQAFGKAIMIDDEQRKMSQYIKNFQLPYLPERQIRKKGFKAFKRLWKHSEPNEVDDYLKVFRNPKQLTATLNYYRSNYKLLKKAAKHQILGDINVPTLFIWGNKDLAVGSYSVSESHQYMKSEYEFLELDAGHWLIQTNYNDLEEVITKHVNRNKDN
ncbi:alpha/beta hydrolase [Flagellimonas pacifica]|uniref:Pimeloyl-ACP methyl ester carboxylesterase n=1 Tax=Flagellimonas pacifica TaxID=1247520 RepID=A0A285MQN3_9FLAO|nr:alpha/beta hydrolase [Allomuricauda parva]SNY99480.1 Pimeloyl-ACP methyl ester carboxylesterase [Allomuricauda parva]